MVVREVYEKTVKKCQTKLKTTGYVMDSQSVIETLVEFSSAIKNLNWNFSSHTHFFYKSR